jgi:hypothetical protein
MQMSPSSGTSAPRWLPALNHWLSWLLPLLLLGYVWLPHFAHFHPRVPTDPPGSTLNAADPAWQSQARQVFEMPLSVDLGIADDAYLLEQLQQQRLRVQAYGDLVVPMTGYPADLTAGPVTLNLALASLEVERRLLVLYFKDGDREKLRLVMQRLEAFDRYESGAFLPEGLLWNDHAVAARIPVLAGAMLALHKEPEFAPQHVALQRQAMRAVAFLSDPEHYNAKTNHGIMQDVALLQASILFATHPDSGEWWDLAQQRLLAHLRYYVSDEGVVLEHSLGYQALGAELLGMAERLFQVKGQQVPAELAQAAARTHEALAYFTRPDGSAPPFGNTAIPTDFLRLKPAAQLAHSYIAGTAGYAVWRRDLPAGMPLHLTQVWSHFPNHGHKHADEGAVFLWRDGLDWITAVGYWPYHLPGIDEANGWEGANAPHYVGMSAKGARTTRLQALADTPDLLYTALESRTPGGLRLPHRQLIQSPDDSLWVLDSSADASRPIVSTWTFPAALQLEQTGPGSWTAIQQLDGSKRQMHIQLLGADTKALVLKGSEAPFGGWLADSRNIQPTTALRVRSVGPMMLRFSFGSAAEPAASLRWRAEDDWAVMQADQPLLERRGQRLRLAGQDHALTASADSTSARQAILDAGYRMRAKYPLWRDLSKYRLKLSYALLGLAGCGVVANWLWRRRNRTLGTSLTFGAAQVASWLALFIATGRYLSS